jgi:outer membrane protein OmpA-like peptidoglycan-associated protein
VLSENTTGFTAKRKLGFYEEKEVNLAYDAELYADTTYPLTICLTKSSKRYKQVIDGELLDCDTKKPINKAYVTAINAFDSSKNITYKTTNRGKFMFDLNDSVRTILFEKKDYFDKDTLSPYSDLVENDTVYKMTYCIELYSAEKVPIALITDPTKVNSKINEINKRDSTVIYFDFNKTDIKPEAALALDVILKDLKSYPSIDIVLKISGHTDSKGSAEVNFRIGRQRAISCLDYLISKGIPESRLRLISKGKTDPVAKETINNKDNPAGRAKNRRVVLKVEAKLAAPLQK